MRGMKDRIDFVITWVDGGDPAWRAQRERFAPDLETDCRPERYRDWETLRYWFRGVEQFAPWVETIHFVTWGHLPQWFNAAHPRVHVVRHEDFMPAQALPTFNSNALEMNLHRIPGLSERFVYFNDDMLVLRPLQPDDFFVGDKPRDMLALQPVVANPNNPVMSHILLNDSLVICKHFDKRATMRKNRGAYFRADYPMKYFIYNLLETAFPLYTGFYTVHGASPLRKSTFVELWEKEETLLRETTMHRFRDSRDVTQYLFREWQKQTGAFIPANLHRDFRYLDLGDPRRRYLDVIRARTKKMICINDTSLPIDFERTKAELLAAFEAALPQKSSFEV